MIWRKESGKIWKYPLVWGLLLLFFLFNLWNIYISVGTYSRREWRKMHEISRDGQWDPSVVEYAQDMYEDLDIVAMMRTKMLSTGYEPKGAFREFVNECYRFFDGRVKEIRANGEGEGDYYPGQYLEIHNILYVDILSYVWLEMAILVSFLVIYLMDYERICRTADLVYSSPKGREIQVRKLLVGLVHGMAASLLLLGGTLAVFFLIVPMEGLWEVPVTAPLVANVRVFWLYPFITYQSMTVGAHLIASLITGLLLALGVGILSGILQIVVRNSYRAVIILLILLLGLYVLSGVQTGTYFDVFCRMSPAGLWGRCGTWFMEWDLVMCFQGNEILTLIFHYLICAIGVAAGVRRWMRSDL